MWFVRKYCFGMIKLKSSKTNVKTFSHTTIKCAKLKATELGEGQSMFALKKHTSLKEKSFHLLHPLGLQYWIELHSHTT